MNFASLFNQFRSQTNYGLNELLEQPGLKMGRLLDQDSFSSEYKSNNPKVAQIMKYDKYLELVEFITVVGSADDKKRSFKYPLNASDFLCIDNWQALEFILPDKPIFQEKKVYETTTQDIQMEVEVTDQVQSSQKEDIIQQTDQKMAVNEEKTEQVKQQPQLIQQTTNQPQIQQTTNQPQQAKEQIKQVQKSVENEVQAIQKKVEKKYRKIVVQNEKTIERIQKTELSPLILKILAYFDNEVNYTLAGYVSKVLSYLFTKKPVELLKYIFQNDNIIKILNHAESRSVGDFIIKVITYESSACLQERSLFFKKLLQRLCVSSEIQIMSNLSAYVCEIIQKIAVNLKGNNKIPEFASIITEVIKNIMSDDENVSVYNSPIIFVFLTSIPFGLPEDQQKKLAFKSLLQNFIQKSCSKLQINSESMSRLGVGRMKILQILRFILKENIMNVREIIGQNTAFLPILFNLMKQYSMNNMLHNQIIKILDIVLNEDQSSALSKLIVNDDVLLNFLVEEANKDIGIRTGNSVYKTRKGYAAHLINLFIKLREMSQKNINIKAITLNQKFINLYQVFVQKENYKTSINLAGYAMKKQRKHEIMFQKQDIINSHITFLQKCPQSVFDVVPEHINIQHPDLVEDLVKQLEQKIHQKNEQSDLVVLKNEIQELANEKAPEAMQVEEQQRHNNFWVKHLDYNVIDLMAVL